MGTKRKNKRTKTGRRKCKYGKLKKSVKTKSGRRRCKKSKRKYKAGELFDKVDRGAKFIQDYASIKDKLPICAEVNIVPINEESIKFHEKMGFKKVSEAYSNSNYSVRYYEKCM